MLSSNEDGSSSASVNVVETLELQLGAVDLMETIEPRIDNLSMKCFSIITNNANKPPSAVDLVDTVEPRRDIPQSDTESRDSIVKLTSKPSCQSYRRTVGLSETELEEIGYSNHSGKWRGFPYDSWSCCKSNELQCPVVAASTQSEPNTSVLSIAKATLHSRTTDGGYDRPERLYLKFLKKSTKSTIPRQVSREIRGRSRSTGPVSGVSKYDKGPKETSVRKFVIKINPQLSDGDGNSSCLVSSKDNPVGAVNHNDGSVKKGYSSTYNGLQKIKQSSTNQSSSRKTQMAQPNHVHGNTTDLPSDRSHREAKKTRDSTIVETPGLEDPIILQSIGDRRLRITLANEYSDANTISSALLLSNVEENMPATEDLDLASTARNEVLLGETSNSDGKMDSFVKIANAGEEKATQTAWPAFSHGEPAKLIESIKRKLSKNMTSRSTPLVPSRKSTSASPSSRYYFSPVAVTAPARSASTTVVVDVTKRFGSDHLHGSTSPAWVPASKSADLSSSSVPLSSFNHSDALTTTRIIDRAIEKPRTTRLSFPKPSFSSSVYVPVDLPLPIEDRYTDTFTSRSIPIRFTGNTGSAKPDSVPVDKEEPSLTLPTKEDSNKQVIDRHRDWLVQVLRAKELHEERGYYKNSINARV